MTFGKKKQTTHHPSRRALRKRLAVLCFVVFFFIENFHDCLNLRFLFLAQEMASESINYTNQGIGFKTKHFVFS